MKTRSLLAAWLLLAATAGLSAQTSAFTYQGQLLTSGQPANGVYDLTFQIFDASESGTPVSMALTNATAISNGVFTVLLNFGPGVFTGGDRWMQIQVRTNGAGAFSPLSPRQYISPTPYAIQAGNVTWENLSTINTGPGITVGTSNALRVVFAGSGTNTAAARSDHQHFGQAWSGAGETALALTNTSAVGSPAGLIAQTAYTNSISIVAMHGSGSGYVPRPAALSASSGQLPAITASSALAEAIFAESYGSDAIIGWAQGTNLPFTGVSGLADALDGAGIYGAGHNGVKGETTFTDGNGVVGIADYGANAYAIWGTSTNGYAGWFDGKVHVNGTLTKAAGQFQIDHPLDPANQWLSHSFVESPDMKNIYDGIAVLDAAGEAVVELPAWFAALNRDYRYQLTPLGAPSPNLYVAAELNQNRFKIAGGGASQKISWQITGIRQDRYALDHPVVVEREKTAAEKAVKRR